MSFKRMTLLCLAGVMLLGAPLFATGIAYLSDTTKVMLALDHIRRSIRESDADKFVQAVSPQVDFGNETMSSDWVRSWADSLFSGGGSRKVFVSKPDPLPFGDFWDFGIEDISLTFEADTCVVSCMLKLYAAPRERGEIRSKEEILKFVKNGDLWLLMKFHQLFEFLVNGGGK